jgi:hypothetical protein
MADSRDEQIIDAEGKSNHNQTMSWSSRFDTVQETFIYSDGSPHPHMFPCHRSHSWISGGDHFLVKNS